jgi:hypothetical protein
MIFLNSTKIKRARNFRAPKRDLEERLFYRHRASPRFHTAKTHVRHGWAYFATKQSFSEHLTNHVYACPGIRFEFHPPGPV